MLTAAPNMEIHPPVMMKMDTSETSEASTVIRATIVLASTDSIKVDRGLCTPRTNTAMRSAGKCRMGMTNGTILVMWAKENFKISLTRKTLYRREGMLKTKYLTSTPTKPKTMKWPTISLHNGTKISSIWNGEPHVGPDWTLDPLPVREPLGAETTANLDVIDATKNATQVSALSVVTRGPRAPPTEAERQLMRLQRLLPIFAPSEDPAQPKFLSRAVTLHQEECNHHFRTGHYDETSYNLTNCAICDYIMQTWFNYCTDCGLVDCNWCSDDFESRMSYYHETDNIGSRVAVILWAENGAPPHRFESRQAAQTAMLELESDDADWGLEAMIDSYEEELFLLQPFNYHDFGMRLMFDEFERSMLVDYWPIREENVGFQGIMGKITFRLDTNPFVPLFWDDV
jgi:hypothetical protein